MNILLGIPLLMMLPLSGRTCQKTFARPMPPSALVHDWPLRIELTGSAPEFHTVYNSSLTLVSHIDNFESRESECQWVNNRGNSGLMTHFFDDRMRPLSWTAVGIPLKPSDNIITVNCTDYYGNKSAHTITITYNPTIAFILADPDSHALAEPEPTVNKPTVVTFTISIAALRGARLGAGGVKIHQLDDHRRIIDNAPFPVTLYGNIPAGDDYGVFTGTATLLETTTAALHIRLIADTLNGSIRQDGYSDVFDIPVLTKEEIKETKGDIKNWIGDHGEEQSPCH